MAIKTSITNIAVVGAGTMGHALALIFAQNGYRVKLWSLYESELVRAMELIESALNSIIQSGYVQKREKESILDRVRPSTDLETVVSDAHFVLEAVSESPEIKKALFARLNTICSTSTCFASNTSGLNIYEIAEIDCPERLIITHWFSPPTLIPLVEIIPGPETSEEVISSTVALLEGIGKKTVRLKRFFPFFIVNRIQNAINEAVLEMIDNDWAEPAEIDMAVKCSLGIRLPVVGVVQSLDFAGLDLIHSVMQRNGKSSEVIREKVSSGSLGAKSSKGFYDYQDRKESEIVRKRDDLYLRIRTCLDELCVFEPI